MESNNINNTNDTIKTLEEQLQEQKRNLKQAALAKASNKEIFDVFMEFSRL